MNTFIIYVALPALFFQLLAKTPFERLTEWKLHLRLGLLDLHHLLADVRRLGDHVARRDRAVDDQGPGRGLRQYRLHGAGLALLAFGQEAAVPVALIFCFENILHFAIAPMMMALSGDEKSSPPQLRSEVARKILLHPFIIATAVGVAAAYLQFQPPVPVERLLDYLSSAAAPCALFAMGVTLALRPLKRDAGRARADRGAEARSLHPLICYVVLSWVGNFSRSLDLLGGAAGGAADGDQRLRHRPAISASGCERASASVLLTTCMSVATVTGLL